MTDFLGIGTIIDKLGQTPNKLIDTSGDIIKKGEDIVGGIGNNLISTTGGAINNFVDATGYSVRMPVKTVSSVIDNQLDNFWQLVLDTKTDIINIIQLGLLLFGAGFITVLILHGNDIMKNGLSLGSVRIF